MVLHSHTNCRAVSHLGFWHGRRRSSVHGSRGKEYLKSSTIFDLFAFFSSVCDDVAISQGWDLFVNVQSIIVLVPSLLGLKGDLEMTLASRLSTQVSANTLAKTICIDSKEVVTLCFFCRLIWRSWTTSTR